MLFSLLSRQAAEAQKTEKKYAKNAMF